MRTRFGACALLVALPITVSCARYQRTAADEAAVYEALLDEPVTGDSVILQDVSEQMPLSYVIGPGDRPLEATFTPEVREALEDLSRLPRRRLPESLIASEGQRRLAPDSTRALFEAIRSHRIDRLPGHSAIVQFSGIGFSRDGNVAVVYRNHVCGELCGGGEVRAIRRHPSGWLPAEVLAEWVY